MNEIVFENVSYNFISGNETIEILKDCSFEIKKGELIALVAPSGSGKTTLLNLLSLLDKPKSGNIYINNKNTTLMTEREKTEFRRSSIGMVFQYHNLLSDFSCLENIMMPLLINKINKQEAKRISQNYINRLHLVGRENHKPGQLSGGEKQRTAIARALVKQPIIVIGDEPTGSLDTDTAQIVMDLFIDSINDAGLTGFIVTHDIKIAQQADQIFYLKNKKIE